VDRVIIRDMVGRTIDIVEHPANNFRFNYTLKDGTYLVYVQCTEGNFIRKVVVQSGR